MLFFQVTGVEELEGLEFDSDLPVRVGERVTLNNVYVEVIDVTSSTEISTILIVDRA